MVIKMLKIGYMIRYSNVIVEEFCENCELYNSYEDSCIPIETLGIEAIFEYPGEWEIKCIKYKRNWNFHDKI